MGTAAIRKLSVGELKAATFDDRCATVGADGIFPTAGKVALVDIVQAGIGTDATGSLQSGQGRSGNIGHAVGRMKGAKVPRGVATELIGNDVGQVGLRQ